MSLKLNGTVNKMRKVVGCFGKDRGCKGGKGYGYDYEECPRKLSVIDPNFDLQIRWIYVFCSTSA